MSRVSETKIFVQFESRECKCGLNESVWNINWNGVMMNIGVSVKMIVCVILLHVIMSAIKYVKFRNI